MKQPRPPEPLTMHLHSGEPISVEREDDGYWLHIGVPEDPGNLILTASDLFKLGALCHQALEGGSDERSLA